MTGELLGLDGRKMSKSYGNAIFLSNTEKRRKRRSMRRSPHRPRFTLPITASRKVRRV